MQLIANDLDASETQVVSFHPGAIYTAAAKAAFDGKAKSEVDIPFDDGKCYLSDVWMNADFKQTIFQALSVCGQLPTKPSSSMVDSCGQPGMWMR
jgi:uncharacterized protein (DUF2345 family)